MPCFPVMAPDNVYVSFSVDSCGKVVELWDDGEGIVRFAYHYGPLTIPKFAGPFAQPFRIIARMSEVDGFTKWFLSDPFRPVPT